MRVIANEPKPSAAAPKLFWRMRSTDIVRQIESMASIEAIAGGGDGA